MAGGLLALNFFSPAFVDQLKRGRKTATIRLGDKSRKYERGQVVWITVGYQHSPREKIFAAVIDGVEVKRIKRALAARHRARQPRVSPPRGDARLPAPDLRPRHRPRGHGHGDPLLSDRRVGRAAARQRRDALAELAPADARIRVPDDLVPGGARASGSGTRSGTPSAGPSGGAGVVAARTVDGGRRDRRRPGRPIHVALQAALRPRVRDGHHPGREAPPARGRGERRAGRDRALAPVRAGRRARSPRSSTSGT